MFASCVKEVNTSIYDEEKLTIEYNVTIEPETKAGSNDISVTHIWYASYMVTEVNGEEKLILSAVYQPSRIVDGKADCPVEMVKGRTYRNVFVAQHYDANSVGAYDIDVNRKLINLSDSPVANSDDYDLFWGTDKVVAFNGTNLPSVTLKRKVAKLNFITDAEDWNLAEANDNLPTHSSITVNYIPSSISLIDGGFSNVQYPVTFEKNVIPANEFSLGSVYFPVTEGNVEVTMLLYKDDNLIRTVKATDIPVAPNYVTNLKTTINNY
jgi:hypothetical protein